MSMLEAGAAPGASPPALLLPVGDSSFSALHAAAVGGCAAAVPALVAAGAPLDASLQLPDLPFGEEAAEVWFAATTALRQLVGSCDHQMSDVLDGGTALAMAVR